MPVLHSEVVSALFESYLTIRRDSWGLNGAEINPASFSGKIATKLTSCQTALHKIHVAKTTEGLISFVNDISNRIRSEQTAVTYKKSGITGFIANLIFYDRDLMLETLSAARSYVLGALNKDPEGMNKLLAHKSELLAKKTILELEIDELIEQKADASFKQDELALFINKFEDLGFLDSLENSGGRKIPYYLAKNYHEKYFNDVIKSRDATAKKLDERNFAEFVKNVENNLRENTISKKLLSSYKPHASAVIAPQAAATSEKIYGNTQMQADLGKEPALPKSEVTITQSVPALVIPTHSKNEIISAAAISAYSLLNKNSEARANRRALRVEKMEKIEKVESKTRSRRS